MTSTAAVQQQQQQQHHEACVGHCRAQRWDMDYGCSVAYETEKANIKSYEDGWDEYDGPVWPWRHTNVPAADLQKTEDAYVGCTCHDDESRYSSYATTPSEEIAQPTAIKAERKTETTAAAVSGTNLTVRAAAAAVVASASASAGTATSSSASSTSGKLSPLWNSRASSPCPHCGRGGKAAHHL